jgi:hypothetical protein
LSIIIFVKMAAETLYNIGENMAADAAHPVA